MALAKTTQITSEEFDILDNRIAELATNYPQFKRLEATMRSIWIPTCTIWLGGRRAFTGTFNECLAFIDGIEAILEDDCS